jgi:hypothetical protein
MRLSTLGVGGGAKQHLREYTTNGTFIFPTGVYAVRAFLQAAGGSGSTNEASASAAGGNGGDALVDFLIKGEPGDELDLVIGAGGAARTGSVSALVGLGGGDTYITLPNNTKIRVSGGAANSAANASVAQPSSLLTRLPNYIPGGRGSTTSSNGESILGANPGGVGAQYSGAMYGGGGGASFFGPGLNGGASTGPVPCEVWDAETSGYGGGGGGFCSNSLTVNQTSGAGGNGAIWFLWEGADYGT